MGKKDNSLVTFETVNGDEISLRAGLITGLSLTLEAGYISYWVRSVGGSRENEEITDTTYLRLFQIIIERNDKRYD